MATTRRIDGSAVGLWSGDESEAEVEVDFEVEADSYRPSADSMEGHRSYLRRVAARQIGPDLAAKVEASDLVQMTYLAAYRDVARFRRRSPGSLRAWLHAILLHVASNTRRHFRRAALRQVDREVPLPSGGFEPVDDATPPGDRLERLERVEAMLRAVSRLPEADRRVVEWHHREGLGFDVIADRLGTSPDAARKRWGRALARLRAELGPDG